MRTATTSFPQPMDFGLPRKLEAGEPPEERGLARDDVKLMVSHFTTDRITHTRFNEIHRHLLPGDVLVLNTSGTLNAALRVTRADGTRLELHLSTHIGEDQWTVELRLPGRKGTIPFLEAVPGEILRLPRGATATLLRPYSGDRSDLPEVTAHRLWVAELSLTEPWLGYLERNGFPIRYGYVHRAWPSRYYQTVYATEPGSAEMPSAGRPFTVPLLQEIEDQGVRLARLVLHTGVASLESHEPPYAEQYRVPVETARLVNEAHAQGHRVIAVGTTAVRALETVSDASGTVSPGEGWTHLVVTPERGLFAVDGLLTGLHEPRASHLAMLEALAGRHHLEVTYREALREHYLWHEFGDVHLIVG
jgi:S-adenosylmethionine:tRNA ribosyltransferase-isomerase